MGDLEAAPVHCRGRVRRGDEGTQPESGRMRKRFGLLS